MTKKHFENSQMLNSSDEETYYELLKVDSRASVAEIVSAYHTAKNAFSKDSVATYSLFTAEEARQMLSKLEEAYLTLSNIGRRADYDKRLTQGHSDTPLRMVVNNTAVGLGEPDVQVEARPEAPTTGQPEALTAPLGSVAEIVTTSESTPASQPLASTEAVEPAAVSGDEVSGGMLRDLREKRGLSLEDVARITKIPSAFLRAIEGDRFKRLPARVYIQGFIKNMAVLYKVDPKVTAQGYLSFLDRSLR